MKLKIWRCFPNDTYIIGKFFIDGYRFCDTLERPWKDNATDISCIPCGTYKVKMLWSEHFQRNLPHIMDVPDRADILIHPANFVVDLKGCVGVGRNTIKGGLTESRFHSNALNSLLEKTKEDIEIEIV